MLETIKEFLTRLLDAVKGWFGGAERKDADARQAGGGADKPPADAAPEQEDPQRTVEPEVEHQPQREDTPVTEIRASYGNLKRQGGEDAVPGFAELDHYPFKPGMNFQALDFPALAEGRKAWMLGNNQAFFFIANPKGNEDPAQVRLDTGNLRTLMGNIHDHGTLFTMMVDGDLLANPANFVERYQALRPEQDESVRRAMLGREAELIGEFLQGGGIRALAREVIAEKEPGLNAAELDAKAGEFVQKNFRYEPLRLDEPLKAAVWQVEGPDGALCARQRYSANTDATERPWQLGTQPELDALRAQGHEGARNVVEAVRDMHYQRLLTAYKDIQDPRAVDLEAGYTMHDGYPEACQANLFPLLAGEGGEVKILGANQAFYFTKTDRRPGIPAGERVTQDTGRLEELMGNVYDSKSRFTLMLDADAVSSRGYAPFGEKYLKLRPEPEEEARAMQSAEHGIMRKFFREGGIRRVATKVIMEREGEESPTPAVRRKVDGFLRDNFHVVTVDVPKEKPLDGAVWEVDVKGTQGKLCAKQAYSEGTQNIRHGFHLGSMPELERLSRREDEVGKGARLITDAVADMNRSLERETEQARPYARAVGRSR